MEPLLLLVHRIPYPPNKGDKIRSYHLLKHLAQRYRVHLGAFVDDPNDWQYVDAVKKFCDETYFANLNPAIARLRSLRALAANRPLSLDYYRNANLRDWVGKVLKEKLVQNIVVFSSPMAQYVEHAAGARRIIDLVDVDSDKWLQYANNKVWPMSWIYRREGRQLLRYERHIATTFDASLLVSQAEANLFRGLAPGSADKIGFFNNGVDTDYFSPARDYPNPYASDEKVIVFTGAMDYWPNVDAVQWFARDIFSSVRAAHPDAAFYIVGARPSSQVQELASLPNVHVTGSVPDVRPYMIHARAAVAPLRIARGIQNKVLEAMAMAKPVVVSPQALEGIDAEPGKDLLLANTPKEFIETVSFVLTRQTNEIGLAARMKVESRYDWAGNLAQIDQLLDSGANRLQDTEQRLTANLS